MRTACRIPSEGVGRDHWSAFDFDCGLNVSGTLDVGLVIQLMPTKAAVHAQFIQK